MGNRPIKVVHILEGFLGGTCTYVCTVLPQLVQKGFDVTLICSLNRCCPDAAERISALRKSGVTVYIIPMYRKINPLNDFRSVAVIRRLLLQNKFDVIHTHCSKAGALGRIAAVLAGRNVVVHSPHCFAFLRCNNRFNRLLYLVLEQLLGRLTSRLVAVSRSEAAIAIRARVVSRGKCNWVENGLANGRVFPSATGFARDFTGKVSIDLPRDKAVVTTACRLVSYKGIFRFLEAARVSRANDVVFLLAGDGNLKTAAERFIFENRLSNKVKLLGHISNMEQIYAISDIVALCSDAEAQPYLLLEAMRAMCPIVATSVIGNRELIAHDKTGFLAEPTPASIAAAIDQLLADKAKRRAYAENAYIYFCRHHSLEKQISRLTEIYESCIRDGQA
ncbi:MAG TPA: glycosyltransferase [Sedimentisphaerales bacterium]|nr:glycosyltransferase [Sedimentisphaerales bacterium]